MICEDCAAAGEELKLGNSAGAEMHHQECIARNANKPSPGCTCQHRIVSMLNPERVDLSGKS